jgi:predicted negative regulator of RcsB-dependent stress response
LAGWIFQSENGVVSLAYESDEEQLDALKRWWKDNGNSILAGIAFVLIVYFGMGQFQSSRENAAGRASDLYQQISELSLQSLSGVMQEDDMLAAQSLYNELKTDYANSIYARYAALLMARIRVENDQLEQAATELQWILDNPKLGFMRKADEELFTITRLRLARVRLSMGDAQSALAVLNAVPVPEEFIAGYAEVEGDIQLQLNNTEAARAAYLKALIALTASGTGNPALLQLKLQELGVSPTETF